MSNRGVYGTALIKKRLYWPKGFHRDIINEYLSFFNDGVICLSGEWDEMEFNIFLEGTRLKYNADVGILGFDFSGWSEVGKKIY